MKFMRLWMCLAMLMAAMTAVAAPAPAGNTSLNGLESLQISKAAGSTILKIGLREALAVAPSNFSIANPARLVFDLPATENALGFSSRVVNEGALRSLNVVQAGERSRLVLNLDRMMRFESRQDGKYLLITLLDEGSSPAPDSAVPMQHFAGSDKGSQSIRDIQFRRGKDGAGIVVIDLSSTDGGADIYQKGSTLLVSFKKTRLPEQLRRQLDVVDFATPITTIKTRPAGEDVSLEILPKGLWEHTAFQTDNQFIVEVRPLKEDPGKLFQGSKTGYQGEAISLNFQNIPLRELLHVFADITNFNIVVSDSVGGNVSLRLNDVAWDHALEIVLQQKNLAMRKSGNVLWIAPRDELAARDKTEAEARDAAVLAEIPRLEVFQLNYQKAEEFSVMLSSSQTAADPSAKGPASPQGGFLSAAGKVTVDKRTNQVFIYDVPSKLDLIRGLLTKIDRPARQVLIEARIVEADTSFSKALGARLGGHDYPGMGAGHKVLGLNGMRYGISATSQDAYTHLPEVRSTAAGQPLSLPGQMIGATAFATDGTLTREAGAPDMSASQFASNPVSSPLGQFALTLFNNAKTQLLTLEISALETDGKGKTISSPRVLTADQIEATIQDGERIPYLSASSSGATSVSWMNATLALKVKPQITPDGRVLMTIKINKDSRGQGVILGAGGAAMPAIKTKEIVSEVHIENGGTVVIGGVFEMTEFESTGRVPFLGDLPYVGFMFKKKERSESKKELIIMLTPKIVDDAVGVKL